MGEKPIKIEYFNALTLRSLRLCVKKTIAEGNKNIKEKS